MDVRKAGNRVELYVHLVWGTHRRHQSILPEIEAPLFRVLAAKCLELKCTPCAIGGTRDHVHLLARLHPSVPIARIVAELKGASSHFVSHKIVRDETFRWQSGYGAFSISAEDVPAVTRYVLAQKQHHASFSLHPELEP
jgi:putative transposase